LYTSSYTRKRGKFYHLVFEYIKNKKKTVKSKSSKTDNEELAEEMLKVFEEECRKFFGISEDKKIGSRKSVFTKVDQDVNLFDHIDIDKNNTHVPDASAENLDQALENYQNELNNTNKSVIKRINLHHVILFMINSYFKNFRFNRLSPFLIKFSPSKFTTGRYFTFS